MKSAKEIDTEIVRSKIINNYGSLRKGAKALGIHATQLSRWLEKPSERFYLLLVENKLIDVEQPHHEKIEEKYFMERYRKIIEEQEALLAEQRKFISTLMESMDKLSRQIGILSETKKEKELKDKKDKKDTSK